MTSDDTDPPAHNPRMHQGGKLSFRGRVQEGDDQPGDRLVLGGKAADAGTGDAARLVVMELGAP